MIDMVALMLFVLVAGLFIRITLIGLAILLFVIIQKIERKLDE